MKTSRGVKYPSLMEAISFYNVPGTLGGFAKHEAECNAFLIRMPQSGVTLSIDAINKAELMSLLYKYKGKLPEDIINREEIKIDKVCHDYINAIASGDLSV